MEKQFQIYSVDTKVFYNDAEEKLNKRLIWINYISKMANEYSLYVLVEKNSKKPLAHKFNDFKDYYTKMKEFKAQKDAEGNYIKAEDIFVNVKKYMKNLIKKNKKLMKTDGFKLILNLNPIVTFYNKYNAKELIEYNKIKADNKGKKKCDKTKLVKLLSLKEKINLKLNVMLKANSTVRELNTAKVSKYNLISLFSSDLSRIMELDDNQVTTDLLIVRVFHYPVLEQLIDNGYTYLGEKYKCLTSSAGQIRTKKVLMIKESVWVDIKNTVMCGLSIEDINASKECGMSINKYLSYLALCGSASDKIDDKKFDITKCIVIRDFETVLKGRKVDYVDNETFEVKERIMDITIPHSDGCGWVLPSVSRKSFQFRMPWFKGLMTPVNYIAFCDQYRNSDYTIMDIDNVEHDLKTEGIEYVFSESQFKMHKYYKDWKQYQDNFIKFNCNANSCNVEEDFKNFKNSNMNYQMWQTLSDVTDPEIESFTDTITEYITKSYSDSATMLNILGADSEKKHKNNLQQCLEVYPELMKDGYMETLLRTEITKSRKDAKFGRIKIDAKNTFLIPDVFAWMQFIFLNRENPIGLLKNGEVSCKLYKKEPELIVNRSPHLFLEHCLRDNVISPKTNQWFLTNGVYTSSHDLISKYLQFDVDGDHSLVISDHRLIEIVRRTMKGVLPLYYEMGKAKPELINGTNIYKGLVTGFKYSNIGQYSNKLTAIFNKGKVVKKIEISELVLNKAELFSLVSKDKIIKRGNKIKISDEDLNTCKVITALNNYCIDSAKTLEMKAVPKGSAIDKSCKEANKLPLPYFFQYAKDKDIDDLTERNDSTVNRICKKIEDADTGKYDFSAFDKFNHKMMMHNNKIVINEKVVAEYKRLNKEMQKYFFKNVVMEKKEIAVAVWEVMTYEFDNFCSDNNIEWIDAVDSILAYIYKNSKDCKKALLFNVFGDIILANLKENIKNPIDNDEYIICACCQTRVLKKSNRQTMCPECAKVEKARKKLERQQIARADKKVKIII